MALKALRLILICTLVICLSAHLTNAHLDKVLGAVNQELKNKFRDLYNIFHPPHKPHWYHEHHRPEYLPGYVPRDFDYESVPAGVAPSVPELPRFPFVPEVDNPYGWPIFPQPQPPMERPVNDPREIDSMGADATPENSNGNLPMFPEMPVRPEFPEIPQPQPPMEEPVNDPKGTDFMGIDNLAPANPGGVRPIFPEMPGSPLLPELPQPRPEPPMDRPTNDPEVPNFMGTNNLTPENPNGVRPIFSGMPERPVFPELPQLQPEPPMERPVNNPKETGFMDTDNLPQGNPRRVIPMFPGRPERPLFPERPQPPMESPMDPEGTNFVPENPSGMGPMLPVMPELPDFPEIGQPPIGRPVESPTSTSTTTTTTTTTSLPPMETQPTPGSLPVGRANIPEFPRRGLDPRFGLDFIDKPGYCPSSPRGPWICSSRCFLDSDCRGEKKCCRNRCGANACVTPTFDEPLFRDGI